MRLLFFLRHYNDIDNIAPAIYFLLEDDPGLVADVVLYHEDYLADGDPNLEMLIRVHGERCRVRHIGDLYGLSPTGPRNARRVAQFVRRTIDLVERMSPSLSRGLHASYVALGRRVRSGTAGRRDARPFDIAAIRTGLADPAAIRRGLAPLVRQSPAPALAVFDVNRTSHIAGLADGLRSLGVDRIVCLPVSPLINVNVLRAKQHVDVGAAGFVAHHDYAVFDAVGFVERSWITNYARTMALLGLPDHLSDRTTELGSIRYCAQWLQLRPMLLGEGGDRPSSQPPAQSDRPRIAFLLSNSASNTDDAEVSRCFEMMELFPEYDIAVKGHTRSSRRHRGGLASHIRSVEDVSTSDLIDWADAVVFWSTSAAIEGYQRDRFMVCLAYLSSNTNLYEVYDAGFVARCRDDLLEFLVRFGTERSSLRYNREGAQRFIDEVVENRSSGRTVPEAYVGFLREQAAKADDG